MEENFTVRIKEFYVTGFEVSNDNPKADFVDKIYLQSQSTLAQVYDHDTACKLASLLGGIAEELEECD